MLFIVTVVKPLCVIFYHIFENNSMIVNFCFNLSSLFRKRSVAVADRILRDGLKGRWGK